MGIDSAARDMGWACHIGEITNDEREQLSEIMNLIKDPSILRSRNEVTVTCG